MLQEAISGLQENTENHTNHHEQADMQRGMTQGQFSKH